MLASHTRTVCKRTCLSASKPSQRKVKQRAYHLSKKLKDSAVDDAEPYYKRMKGVRLTGRSIYLDMQATTPIDPRVVDSMMPYWTEQFGNPHSRSQMYGWENEEACEIAREKVASIIGADAKEIIFTSGATEANNMALKGVARFYRGKKNHVITTVLEHKCVLDSCRFLEQEGFKVTYLPVDSHGLIDLANLEKVLADHGKETSIVSIMSVNNEIGVIQPLKEIGALCKKHGAFFHTDAAQAVGKIPMNVNEMNVDLMSISGHKIYGPKGVGALYIRRKPRVRIEPIISGGGQERGLRSGTVPTPLVVGFGKACEVAQEEMENDTKHVTKLSQRLFDGVNAKISDVYLNGHPEKRYPGNLNLSFAWVEGESMLLALRDIACSSGSACTSASLEPSYVLRALGVSEDMAHTSIRFGLGRFTTEAEIDYAVNAIVRCVGKLREMSPLYEMVKEGIDIKSIKWAQDH